MDYVLRAASEEDLLAIVEIYNSTIASRLVTADLAPITVDERRPWLIEHIQIGHPVMVAVHDEQVIGWFSFSPFYGRPAYQQTREISLYLRQDVRGNDLGKTILADAEHLAAQQNIKVLLAFIFSQNIPSIQLFKKQNYLHWGELKEVAELDGLRCNLSILGKHLPKPME